MAQVGPHTNGHMAWIIQAEPNGSCLFISLRLALEAQAVLTKARAKERVTTACLDGSAPALLKSAEELRTMIVQWYSAHLDKSVPLGSPPLKRGDILAIEMVRHAHDVPEQGPERDAAIQKYLAAMQRSGTWGSTPEYVAFALMAKLNVRVVQPGPRPQGASAAFGPELKTVDTVAVPGAEYTISLLFDGHSHYDLLVDNPDELRAVWPAAKLTFRSFGGH